MESAEQFDVAASKISSTSQTNIIELNNNSSNYSSSSSSMATVEQQQPSLQQGKSCAEMDALFSGLNHFFRDEDILKESEHSSQLLGYLIVSAYLLVITFGSVGNLLTIMAVVRNKQMRTVRNFFILNLALSDFFVCTVTAPTTLYTVFYVFWSFSRPLCKIAGSLQGFNIFLSTFSITAIALDRYVLVIFPTKRQRQQRLSFVFFSLIWLASILLAAPLFLAADISPIFRDEQCGIELNLCNEQNERWKELFLSKEAYTVGVIILQYLLPLAAIAFAYSRIARRMGARKSRCGSGGGGPAGGSGGSRKNSMAVSGSARNSLCRSALPSSPKHATEMGQQQQNHQPLVNGQSNGSCVVSITPTVEALLNQRRKSIADRHRRTNMLLVTLVVVFACAWLPLNIFHAYTLLSNTFSKTASFSVPIFAVCHLIAMCSACLNPCCYAFFNNNFRQEFIGMYRKLGLIVLYRRMTGFAKRICPNGGSSKSSAAATLSNDEQQQEEQEEEEEEERKTPPNCCTTTTGEQQKNSTFQQQQQNSPSNSPRQQKPLQGVLKKATPLYEVLNNAENWESEVKQKPKLIPRSSDQQPNRRVSILAEAIRMDF